MVKKEKYFEINGKKLAYHELIHGLLEESDMDEYEKNTLLFMQSWLKGDDRFIVPTSGSTGKPKDISISREMMKISAKMTANALKLSAGDRALACINTNYIGGKMMLARALILDMQLTIVTPSSNPLAHMDSSVHFDFIALVPLQLETLLEKDHYVGTLNRARAILVGGAPVGEHLNRKVRMVKAPVYATYGMTETVSHIALKKLNGPGQDRYFKVFKEVVIGQDERGCLTVRSALTGGEKIVTNDQVKIIDQYAFQWLGRIDNVVNTGGIKVQLEELESRIGKVMLELNRHESFIVGVVEDERLGQKLILILEGEGNKDGDQELLALLKERLSLHAPRGIKWISGFSRTNTGKINRRLTMDKLAD